MPRLPFVLALAFGLLSASARAADEKEKPAAKEPAKKAPDWSAYATVGDVAGTVVSADEKTVSVQLTKLYPSLGLSGNGRVVGVRRVYTQTVEYDFKWSDAGLVRWKKLPPKVGADGQKGSYSTNEIEKLRLPVGTTGYAAERTDLRAGHVVDVVLVRPKSVPASRATEADLEIKYAIILGERAAPAAMGNKDK